ncbi:MAG: hypothetical protein ABSA23_16370 [Anaerolineales bacterium]|jgi:hypothetical protein
MDDQKLKDIFKFDESDLEANRNGNLSEKQKNGIVKRRKDWKRTGLNYSSAVIVIGLGIIVIDAVVSYLHGTFPHLDVGAVITGAVFAILGALWLYLTLTGESGKTDLSKDMVKKAEGPANIIKAERTRSSGGSGGSIEHYFAYELHIGDKEFDVDGSLANVIMQQDEYAIYYDDRNGKILSAEFLSKGK